jgi:hypothetical protein
MFAAMMMVSADKNKNTLVVARAKRGGLGRQKHPVIIIEPDPSSALPLVLSAVLGTFQSLAAPPAACRLIFPNTRLIITHPPPSTTTATTEGQGTSPAAAAAILSYPALSCTTTVRPTTRLARFARTGVSWSLRLTRCLPCRRPQSTTTPALSLHHYRRLQTCPPSET